MPTFLIQAPDGKSYDIEGPDQAGALDALKKHLGSQSAPAQQGLDGSDIAKSAGTGLVRGAEGIAGLPGDAAASGPPDFLGKAVQSVLGAFEQHVLGQSPESVAARTAGAAKAKEQITADARAVLPTTQNIAATVEPTITGGQGLHEPTSTAGKYAETAGEFSAGTPLGGLGGFGPRLMRFGIIPGLASEAAGQATAGTPLEGAARIAGGVAAGGVQGLRTHGGIQGQDLGAIGQARDAAYAAARQQGLAFRPNVFQYGMQRLVQGLQGFDPELHPQAAAVVRRIERDASSGQPMTLDGIETIRQLANDVVDSTSAGERRIAGQIVRGLDNFADRASQSPQAITGGNPGAVQIMQQGRALASQAFKAQEIARVFDRAENRAGASATSGGRQTALIQEFKNLANNEAKMRSFSAPERDIIRGVVRGGPMENLLRLIGNLHGPLDLGSFLSWAKPISAGMTRRAAGEVDNAVRGGVPGQRGVPAAALANQVSGNAAPTYGGAQQ